MSETAPRKHRSRHHGGDTRVAQMASTTGGKGWSGDGGQDLRSERIIDELANASVAHLGLAFRGRGENMRLVGGALARVREKGAAA